MADCKDLTKLEIERVQFWVGYKQLTEFWACVEEVRGKYRMYNVVYKALGIIPKAARILHENNIRPTKANVAFNIGAGILDPTEVKGYGLETHCFLCIWAGVDVNIMDIDTYRAIMHLKKRGYTVEAPGDA